MSASVRKEWVREGTSSKKLGRCGGVWVHTSGCFVSHCGHPTANNPYVGSLPDGKSPRILFPAGFNGKKTLSAFVATPKFAELAECQAWILTVFTGDLEDLGNLKPCEEVPA